MKLAIFQETGREPLKQMIIEFFNEHRDMTNSRKEFYIDEKEAEETLDYWIKDSEIYLLEHEEQVIGFTRIRYGGVRSAWLEDLFVVKELRGNGYGSLTIQLIDVKMKENNIIAMFVDVIPRNPAAIRLYQKNGFDHLNMIQLRKNYDTTLNKNDKVDLLGFEFIKY